MVGHIGRSGPDCDLDVVFVRPASVDENDDRWAASIEQWRSTVRALTGNPVEILEVGTDEAASRLTSGRQVWRDIRRDGRVAHGLSLDELTGVHRA